MAPYNMVYQYKFLQDPELCPTLLKYQNPPISLSLLTLKISFESLNHDEEFFDDVSNEWLNSFIKYKSYCLCNPIKNLSLCEAFPFLFGLFNLIMHVTHLTVNHNNAQIAFLISKRILIGHDINMS